MKNDNIVISKVDVRLRRAAKAARAGNSVLRMIALILVLVMLLYGGYSLWNTMMINKGAFVSDDLLKFKPTGEGDNHLTLDELLKLNKDARGWITIDDTHIDYPIVQGESNETYLNTDVYGEFALSGSIFLDYRCSPDFSDSYSILYGHHMDNGAMFGDVAKFLFEDYFNQHQTGTLYLPDRTYKIQLFACLEVKEYDNIIYNPFQQNIEKLNVLFEYIKAVAVQYRDIELPKDSQILGMSTCAEAGTDGRIVLFGRLDRISQAKNGGNNN